MKEILKFAALTAGIFLGLMTYANADTQDKYEQCGPGDFKGQDMVLCTFKEPVCTPSAELPPPAEFAKQRNMRLYAQHRITFNDTGEVGVLNLFVNNVALEYWVYFPNRPDKDTCLMAEAYLKV